MNAPLSVRETHSAAGLLDLFAVFHCNLAFSSIEEEQRGEVIRRCYWPLLDLAERHGPLGIELTGYTLEEIARLDPAWCIRLRTLLAEGAVELIGSGYAQLIGPLVPWRVSEANLRLGHASYRTILGLEPSLALVNEQAYSAGLVPLYLDAGYRAILMDWDNPGAQHPEWPQDTRYQPQRAQGADGRSIGLLWTNTVAFQKLQRLAHGDTTPAQYLDYVRARRGTGNRVFCIYANDSEIFDFRPGRYRTEEQLSQVSEWQTIADAFAALRREPGMRLVAPGEAVDPSGGTPLRLESAACPIPVKKQRKYNLARWAVTGRDDLGINAACERLCHALIERGGGDADWKELCYLWSSDFRTHITQKRWAAYCTRLQAMEKRFGTSVSLSPSSPLPHLVGVRENFKAAAQAEKIAARHCEIETPSVSTTLDRRRGLAIERLRFAGHHHDSVGGLPHGHFDDIALQADWYTGDCVFEAPGEHKITDLEWCDATLSREADGAVCVEARIETPKGPIEKKMKFHAGAPRVDFDLLFDWKDWGRGSLRLGHITLLPGAFRWDRLSLTTHNGGRDPETFLLNGTSVEHGAPVSFLVSSSHGLGMTEGWAEIGDDATRLRIEVDRAAAPVLGFLTHRLSGGSLFCQLVLSALELDETRHPSAYRDGPRRFRFSLSAASA
jgi:hypothetical protein